jgi:hypothetical protein
VEGPLRATDLLVLHEVEGERLGAIPPWTRLFLLRAEASVSRSRRNAILPPSVKFSTVKNLINEYLHQVGLTYHRQIPMGEMMEFMEVHGVVPLDEDGEPLTGVILTGREGRANFPLTYHGKRVRPSWTLTWYKHNTGRYEVTSYVS